MCVYVRRKKGEGVISNPADTCPNPFNSATPELLSRSIVPVATPAICRLARSNRVTAWPMNNRDSPRQRPVCRCITRIRLPRLFSLGNAPRPVRGKWTYLIWLLASARYGFCLGDCDCLLSETRRLLASKC